MKITKELDFPLTVKATLRDDGEVALTLSAVAPYGNRTATATLDKFPDETLEKIRTALQRVIKEYASQVVFMAEQAAAVSMIAAVNMGEEI